MRTLIIALAAGGLMATSASAQVFHRPDPSTNTVPEAVDPGTASQADPLPLPASPGRQTGERDIVAGTNDYPRRTADVGSVSQTAVLAREYPLSWQGSAQGWQMHSAACATRYRGYNATTDMFPLRKGVWAMCPSGMGLNR